MLMLGLGENEQAVNLSLYNSVRTRVRHLPGASMQVCKFFPLVIVLLIYNKMHYLFW